MNIFSIYKPIGYILSFYHLITVIFKRKYLSIGNDFVLMAVTIGP